MNLLYWIAIFAGGLVSVFCTFYLAIGMPAVIIWKIYRKIKYKISLYD